MLSAPATINQLINLKIHRRANRFTDCKTHTSGTPNGEILKKLKRGERLPKEDIPLDVYQLMRQCWEIQDKKRPTFAEMEKTLGDTVTGSYADQLRDE